MNAMIKKEISLPKNCDEGRETGKWFKPYEEITVTKTEIRGESYTSEMIKVEPELMDVQEMVAPEYVSLPRNEIWLADDKKFVLPVLELESGVIGQEKFQENELKCNPYCLKFEEQNNSVHHKRREQGLIKTLNIGSGHFGSDLKSKSDADRRFYCELCKYSSNRKSTLTDHVRIHFKEKPFKCSYKVCTCLQLGINIQNEACECSPCEYATFHKNALRRHILLKHSKEEKKHKCIQCGYSAHLRATLKKHMDLHFHERPLKEAYRNALTTITDLDNCRVKEEKLQETKYICDPCGIGYEERKYLAYHMRRCPYRTKELAKEFDEVGYNIQSNGSTQQRYQCKFCTYSNKSKRVLIVHARGHYKEKPFKCTYKNCKCAQADISAIEKFCECPPCNHATAYKSGLEKHILRIHSTLEKIHKCKYCDFSSHFQMNLRNHMISHSTERPYKCNMCEYTTVSKKYLDKHIQRKHGNKEMKHDCAHCKYSTHIKEDLTRHVRIHSHEK